MNTEILNELNEWKSTLAKVDKIQFTNSNDIPSGYFENMEDRFFAKIKDENRPNVAKSVSIFNNFKLSYAIAAVSAFAIIGLGIFSLIKQENKPQLSHNEVVNFLMEEGEIVGADVTAPSQTTIAVDQLSKEEIKKFLSEVEGLDIANIN